MARKLMTFLPRNKDSVSNVLSSSTVAVREINSFSRISNQRFQFRLITPRFTASSSHHSSRIYTIPNAICVARIASTPAIAYLLVSGYYSHAFGFFVIAGISDGEPISFLANLMEQLTKIFRPRWLYCTKIQSKEYPWILLGSSL